MRYRFEECGGVVAYWLLGTSFWQTWSLAFQFIAIGFRLGLTGRTFFVLPHEGPEQGDA